MFEIIKNKIKNNKIVKNSLIIMTGQTVASIISFINTFIILKGIGVYGNGIIAVVQSYANIFNGVFNFQSYNAMIKFGADALEANDMKLFKQYMKQAFIQDLITAIISIISGYLCVDIVSEFMKWDIEIVYFIKIYLITILFTVTGSINGFLRLFDEFKVGAMIGIKTTIFKLFMLMLGISMNLNLNYYIIVEIIISLLSNMMLFYEGYKCLKKNNCHDFMKVDIKFDKEFTMFNLHNNIVSTLDLPVGQLTTLAINKLLGVNEVGIYNVLIKLGSLVTRVTEPVSQSLLPELSKIVAKRDIKQALKIVKKIFLYTVNCGFVIIIGLLLTYKFWLGLFMPENIENAILVCMYFVYVVIVSSVSGTHLLFICLNLVRYNMAIIIVCNIVYLVMLYFLATNIGLLGIILSLIIQAVMVAIVKYIIMNINIRRDYIQLQKSV